MSFGNCPRLENFTIKGRNIRTLFEINCCKKKLEVLVLVPVFMKEKGDHLVSRVGVSVEKALEKGKT